MAKKITLLCSSFPPEKGAAPNRMYQLAVLLLAKNYEVTVLCAMPNYPTGKIFDAYKGKIIVKEKVDGINVIRLWMWPTNSSNKLKRALSLASYALSLCTLGFWQLWRLPSSIIYMSSPPFVTGVIGSSLAKTLKRKVVLNISDLWPQSAYDLGFLKEGWLYQLLQKKEQKMYCRADAFTVQSHYIHNHILASIPDANVMLYRNLSPVTELPNNERPLGKRIIVYAGLLGIAQGVLRIVQKINFAQLGTELHIYGQGYEAAAIDSFVSQHPNRGVYFHHSVATEKLPGLLTKYHAMLIPLSEDIKGAVPSKIFAAMAQGMPIIFSGNGEAAAIVQENNIGFSSASGDMLGLMRNIETLSQMQEEAYQQLCINSLLCGQQKFNKDKQDVLFLNFLEAIKK